MSFVDKSKVAFTGLLGTTRYWHAHKRELLILERVHLGAEETEIRPRDKAVRGGK